MSGPFLARGVSRELDRYPGSLLALCLLLLGFSLVVIRSASLLPDGSFAPYVGRQLIWAGLGLGTFLALSFVPYSWVSRRGLPLYLLGLVALCLVFVLGTKVNGSRRWFALGPLRAQPSEFMKYLLALYLARVVARRGAGIRTWLGLAEAGLVTAVPFLLVLLEPDLGTALTYLPILGAIVFAAGARLRHLGAVALAGVLAMPVAWQFVLHDYQKMRILAFVDVSGEHALGGAYQTTQSVIAIGSGGACGRGYLQGTQGPLAFLPERHTDFIFGVVGEDFGLVGCAGLLAVYAALLLHLLGIARRTRDPEGRLIVVGVAAITLVQIAVNAGMAMGIAPVTGLTLPLVSYGGSSLLASMAGLGLAASVARHRRLVFAPGFEDSPLRRA